MSRLQGVRFNSCHGSKEYVLKEHMSIYEVEHGSGLGACTDGKARHISELHTQGSLRRRLRGACFGETATFKNLLA